MEKIITIDGRQVKFKSTGAFLLRYKEQFHRDAIKDIYKMQNAIGEDNKIIDIELLDLDIFYNLLWTLAKTADKSIDPPMEWLEEFDTFPLMDIIPEVIDLILGCITTSVDSKKK